MVIHAFRPPAIQRSNKVVKSAVVAAGSGPGQALSSTLARTLPLSMLAQRGVGASTQRAWLACLQPTCDETWWQGFGVAQRAAALLRNPPLVWGEEGR
jgi:hypothetical protein